MHTRTISVGTQTISIETGRLAKQADGAVVVRSGDTMVLVTACAAANPREGIDFLPLTVDYREYTYASGRIPGGFFKREGKPSEKEVLTSRLIDRPIRPLFPYGWRRETQIISLLLSADSENDSDVLAITGASAALALSGIPFTKTIAGVRVGLVDGEYVINPTYEQRRQSRLDLIVAGTKDAIVMVEAGAKEVSEEEVVQAFERAHAAIREIVAGIDALARDAGKKKTELQPKQIAHDFYREVEEKVYLPLAEAMRIKDKLENYGSVDQVLARSGGQHSRRRGRAAQRRQGDLQGAEGKGDARRGARARQAARRPRASTRSVRSASKSACCRAPTGRRCSSAARPRRSSPRRSAPPRISRRSRRSTARPGSASCSTTTSRRSRSAKCSSCAAPAAARSATARSPSARSRR